MNLHDMSIPRATLLLLLLVANLQISSTAIAEQTTYTPFQQLLERHLLKHSTKDGGLITAFDYEAALNDEQTTNLLQQQRQYLVAFDPNQLDSRERAIAFWINAYNYFMLDHILSDAMNSGELVESVRDYGNFFNPYRVFQQDLFDVGGRSYSLDEIEKDILLGENYREEGWFDARVHFAVNCASVGCPALREDIYTSREIDTQLDESTRRALATSLHLNLDGETLYLSELFGWYEDDYIAQSGSVMAFIREHVDAPTAERVQNAQRIRYIDYDWDLNRPDNFEVDFNDVNFN